ncbi:MAG: hypothetical protein O7F71_03175 [Gammaproteobacteria bacterium]|nr:hypothetical protein [Gammaproteobacteria bacterium]
MNITSPNQLSYQIPLGSGLSRGTMQSGRKSPTPEGVSIAQTRSSTGAVDVRPPRATAAMPTGRSTSQEARLQRVPHNRLSELHGLLTYSSTAMGTAMAHGNNIDLYA